MGAGGGLGFGDEIASPLGGATCRAEEPARRLRGLQPRRRHGTRLSRGQRANRRPRPGSDLPHDESGEARPEVALGCPRRQRCTARGVTAGAPARVQLVLLHLGHHARQLHHLVDPRGRRALQPPQRPRAAEGGLEELRELLRSCASNSSIRASCCSIRPSAALSSRSRSAMRASLGSSEAMSNYCECAFGPCPAR